jgi:hypothetical protein
MRYLRREEELTSLNLLQRIQLEGRNNTGTGVCKLYNEDGVYSFLTRMW